ncbi:MAG: S8 family peptidase [Propylenella sp.]
MTPQELQELAQEPEFVAAAEIMKTRLLSPITEPEDAPRAGLSLPEGRRRQSWGIGAVGADRSKFTGVDVAVALLDTGIDAGHPAFRGVELAEKDFTGCGNGDLDGHGTHCAGILFGRNVDGVRIGIAPGIRRAMIGKIIGPKGGDSDMMIRGLCWAHEEGARVISLSAGFDFAATIDERIDEGWPRELAMQVSLDAYRANLRLFDCVLQMARMQEPLTGGAIIVAAAGNDSSRGADGEFVMSASPPAGSDKILSVGSLDRDATGRGYRVSSFSNSGVEIVAPGRGIVSARAGGGLRVLSGTSVAAPHVAGVAALWWQAVRQSDLPANATLVRSKLVSGAESRGFSASIYPAERGAGRVMAPQDGLAVSARRPTFRAPRGERPRVGEVTLRADVARRFPSGPRLEPIAVGAPPEGQSRQRRLC